MFYPKHMHTGNYIRTPLQKLPSKLRGDWAVFGSNDSTTAGRKQL